MRGSAGDRGWLAAARALGDLGMHTARWAAILIGLLACSAGYQFLREPSPPEASQPEVSLPEALQPEASLSVPAPPDPSPAVVANDFKRRFLYEDAGQPLIRKDEARLQDADVAPAKPDADEFPIARYPARQETDVPAADEPSPPNDTKPDLSYLALYAYSEIPPETKPADTVLEYLKDTPPGTPIEEIRRVSDLLGLDYTFMKSVAKIESGFNPNQRTGSYIGLFQLSNYEFGKYGSGNIRDARDNAIAAAFKMMTENILFESFTHKKPTLNDMYLIHQQGIDGATEHINRPDRLAWQSMCATDEGKEKGEKWCKRAIWGNTLPDLKRAWKNVNNVISAAFVKMWQQRLSHFYSRYSQAASN
jgi:hypothetical protein